MNLKEIREKIDALDERITDLFCERMRLCAEVAECKANNGAQVSDAKREGEILVRVVNRAGRTDEAMSEHVAALYSSIFKQSRSYQVSLMERGKGEKAYAEK